jgi:hypothetical protein
MFYPPSTALFALHSLQQYHSFIKPAELGTAKSSRKLLSNIHATNGRSEKADGIGKFIDSRLLQASSWFSAPTTTRALELTGPIKHGGEYSHVTQDAVRRMTSADKASLPLYPGLAWLAKQQGCSYQLSISHLSGLLER